MSSEQDQRRDYSQSVLIIIFGLTLAKSRQEESNILFPIWMLFEYSSDANIYSDAIKCLKVKTKPSFSSFTVTEIIKVWIHMIRMDIAKRFKAQFKIFFCSFSCTVIKFQQSYGKNYERKGPAKTLSEAFFSNKVLGKICQYCYSPF